jgi:hypothetical protein
MTGDFETIATHIHRPIESVGWMDDGGEEESIAAKYKLSEEAYDARPDTFRK